MSKTKTSAQNISKWTLVKWEKGPSMVDWDGGKDWTKRPMSTMIGHTSEKFVELAINPHSRIPSVTAICSVTSFNAVLWPMNSICCICLMRCFGQFFLFVLSVQCGAFANEFYLFYQFNAVLSPMNSISSICSMRCFRQWILFLLSV